MAEVQLFRPQQAEQKTEEEWSYWFYEKFPHFHNPNRAAVLTHALLDGMLTVRRRSHEVLQNYIPPTFCITADSQQNLSSFVCYMNKLIILSSAALLWHTEYPPDESKLHLKSFLGRETLAFRGSFADMYRVFGAEEEDHSIFVQKFGQHESIQDPQLVSLEEYEAQPHEYSALKQKLRVAQEKNMRGVTIEFLQSRLDAVEQYIRDQAGKHS